MNLRHVPRLSRRPGIGQVEYVPIAAEHARCFLERFFADEEGIAVFINSTHLYLYNLFRLLTRRIFRRSLRKDSIDSWRYREGDEAFTPFLDSPGGVHLLPSRASRYYYGPACLNEHIQQGVGKVLLECGNTKDEAIQSVRHLQSGEGVLRSEHRSRGTKLQDRRGAKRPQTKVLGSCEVHR